MLDQQEKQVNKNEFWLFHPGLVSKEKGFTGRYRPSGVDKDGTPVVEMEQIINMKDFDLTHQ